MGRAMFPCLPWPLFSWSSQGQHYLQIIVLATLEGHEVEQTMVHVHGEFSRSAFVPPLEWLSRRHKSSEGSCGCSLTLVLQENLLLLLFVVFGNNVT